MWGEKNVGLNYFWAPKNVGKKFVLFRKKLQKKNLVKNYGGKNLVKFFGRKKEFGQNCCGLKKKNRVKIIGVKICFAR